MFKYCQFTITIRGNINTILIIRFDIGAIETTTLYSSHAKISDAQGDFIDFLLKTTRGPNANGQLKLIIKNAIAANGQFKYTEGDGKGNGMIIVDFKQVSLNIII